MIAFLFWVLLAASLVVGAVYGYAWLIAKSEKIPVSAAILRIVHRTLLGG